MFFLILFLFLQDDYVVHIDHEEEDYDTEYATQATSDQPTESQQEAYVKLPDGSFACNYCRKVFPTKSQIVRHSRIHTGEKPFGCFFCQFKFTQKNHLFRHCKYKHNMTKQHFDQLAKAAGMRS